MSTIKRSAQEARRLIGGQRLENRCDVDKIVNALNAAHCTELAKIVQQCGLEGLLRKENSGRTSKLTNDEKIELQQIIRNGAVAHGFDREQRTSKRVRLVIFERFHVEYNSNDVCELISSLAGVTEIRRNKYLKFTP